MDLTQIVHSFGSSTNPKTTNEEEEVKSTRRGLGQVIESSVKHHHSTPEASLRKYYKQHENLEDPAFFIFFNFQCLTRLSQLMDLTIVAHVNNIFSTANQDRHF